MVLEAAEAVGFYGITILKCGLISNRPKLKVGILLLQRNRVLCKMLDQAWHMAAKAARDHEVLPQIEYMDELTPQNVSSGLLRLAETYQLLGVVAAVALDLTDHTRATLLDGTINFLISH